MTIKYIQHSILGFVLWPRHMDDQVWHKHMANFVRLQHTNGDRGTIVSAGFVDFRTGFPHCYGESESLGIHSLPEDSELLAIQFGIPPL